MKFDVIWVLILEKQRVKKVDLENEIEELKR